MGINVGDIIIDRGDIFGDGVNVAARLEGLAKPGGICISDDAHRQVQGQVRCHFRGCRRTATQKHRTASTGLPSRPSRAVPPVIQVHPTLLPFLRVPILKLIFAARTNLPP